MITASNFSTKYNRKEPVSTGSFSQHRKDRYRAECGGRTDEELSALLESPDAPALLRDAAREVLDSRAEWKAAEQRRRAKETEREQESTPRGGFFSGLFGGRDDDKPRKNQPPEF